MNYRVSLPAIKLIADNRHSSKKNEDEICRSMTLVKK